MTDYEFWDEGDNVSLPHFHYLLGLFLHTWARIEMTTDYAIGRFMGISPFQTHLTTAGAMFGRKARLLADLLRNSDHPRASAILSAFQQIRGHNKRDVLIHGYILPIDRDRVGFLDRSGGSKFNPTGYDVTLKELEDHIAFLQVTLDEFQLELDVSGEELGDFAHAAFGHEEETD